jgi:hypothetical protein
VDADGDVSGNDFDFTSETAYGLEPGFGRGLQSVNNTYNGSFGQLAYAQGEFNGPNPCSPFANISAQPFHGDGSIVQFWDFTANGGVSNTVVSTYKPI